MRSPLVALALVACSAHNSPADPASARAAPAGPATNADGGTPGETGNASGGPGAQVPDAGSSAGAPVPVALSSCDNAATGPFDPGPPPAGGLTWSPGPAPGSTRQSASWIPTGAAGCEGLVPASVPPRLSWTAPAGSCNAGEALADGDGDLALSFSDPSNSSWPHQAFFPADGRAGRFVSPASILGPRQTGFYRTVHTELTQWIFALGPDGSDQGFVRSDSDPACKDFIYFDYQVTPDPRGGYVESRIHAEFANGGQTILRMFEVRWADASLAPRTPWIIGSTWDYAYNVYPQVYVDASGKVLAMLFLDPPMTMPCSGALTRALWASDDGTVLPFVPVTPTIQSAACSRPNFAGFGKGVALAGGGVAFYLQPSNASTSGWYVFYPSGSPAGTKPPSWLDGFDASLKLLAGGNAYLAARRDPQTCARIAAIVGPAGQLCATLALDGSDGCTASESISSGGTLALSDSASCSVRWWPRLGR